jgi:hypothetical protein
MAISGSYDFSLTTNQIIQHAYREVGQLGDNQDLTAAQYKTGREKLNMMVNSWSAEGIYLWALDDVSIQFTASSKVKVSDIDYECILNHKSSSATQPGVGATWQTYWKKLSTSAASSWVTDTSYTNIGNIELDSNIVALESARLRDISGTDTSTRDLKIQTLKDYFELNAAQTEGSPDRIFFKRKESVEIYLYPIPSDTTSNILELRVYRSLSDFDSGDDSPDLLREWNEALYTGLAYRLAPSAGIFGQQLKDLKNIADEARDSAQLSNRETGDMSIQIGG